ncbi:Uncharacterised protein [uncultured archaeon]|nr:Uncharacterised protein [uncultured archaeon]
MSGLVFTVVKEPAKGQGLIRKDSPAVLDAHRWPCGGGSISAFLADDSASAVEGSVFLPAKDGVYGVFSYVLPSEFVFRLFLEAYANPFRSKGLAGSKFLAGGAILECGQVVRRLPDDLIAAVKSPNVPFSLYTKSAVKVADVKASLAVTYGREKGEALCLAGLLSDKAFLAEHSLHAGGLLEAFEVSLVNSRLVSVEPVFSVGEGRRRPIKVD